MRRISDVFARLWTDRSIVLGLVVVMAVFVAVSPIIAQEQSIPLGTPSSLFRVGEKLSYSISFEKFNNAGYAELSAVSRGRIGGRDVVELRSKVKTQELVSAAFYLFDESRKVYAAPDTGLPLYVSIDSHESALPKKTVYDYRTQPTLNYDLLTLIYKLRESGGNGTFAVSEGGQAFSTTFQTLGAERVETTAGDFDTTVSTGQGDYFSSIGVKDLRINFTTDDNRVPVLFRFKTVKGDFRIALSAISVSRPESPAPTPTLVPAPIATPTPKAKPTATPYIDNEPLLPELGFQIGEALHYRITAGGQPVAQATLSVRERKLFHNEDSLLLLATISGVEPGNNSFKVGDAASAQVDPVTLAPRWMTSKFTSPLPGLSQTVTFDKTTGKITFGSTEAVEAPIGTHTLLSLIYAIRSFNLKPSRNLSNPVNDTRVAVFWESKPYVFTLRPSKPEMIEISGEKLPAQLITINTGNPQLDALSLKVWLGTESRVPLRFSFGAFQADLALTSTAQK